MLKKKTKRIAARSIDTALFLCVAFLIVGGWGAFLLAATFVLVSIAGEIVSISVLGGTIGKLILGLRIRTIGGGKVSVLQATQRTSAFWVTLVWAFIVSLVPGPRGEPKWPFGSSEEASWDEICETTEVDLRQP